ncbi:hypothetical protein TNCT_267061 [Trichonephila clavata]|uniref:Uncharacterized protein n=1 Tax=Trichonephila clavata TaxID=2740835 RepID=A0A8X6HDI0_TRICU|nr:hypothetical protein TNCT_267061 [Trichonephila clavata]
MLQPVHGQQDTSLSRKCIIHTTKQWFKTVHEYFKDFDEQHRLPYDKAVLETLVGHPYSFRERYREKSIVFTPPLSRHVDFVFQQSSTRHVSLDYKAMLQTVNGPPKTFQDAMDPLRNKETAKDAHSKKSLY